MGVGKQEPPGGLKGHEGRPIGSDPGRCPAVCGLEAVEFEGNSHNVKVIMTWDILPGKEQEYFEFVVRDFVPGMQRIGIQTHRALVLLNTAISPKS